MKVLDSTISTPVRQEFNLYRDHSFLDLEKYFNTALHEWKLNDYYSHFFSSWPETFIICYVFLASSENWNWMKFWTEIICIQCKGFEIRNLTTLEIRNPQRQNMESSQSSCWILESSAAESRIQDSWIPLHGAICRSHQDLDILLL